MNHNKIAEKLRTILEALRVKEDAEWLEATKHSNFVVTRDLWNRSSRIKWTKKGTCGTFETRNPETNKWTTLPSPEKDTLWLVYLEGSKEFKGKDLSDDEELYNFFVDNVMNGISLYTIEQVDELFKSLI